MLAPSLTADATRLGALRADTPQALQRLLAEAPAAPWDAEVAADDDLVGILLGAGFERYAEGTVMARPIDGMHESDPAPGVKITRYRNDWSEAFGAVEAAALADSPIFREMAQPTGYEGAAHIGGFFAALRGDRLIGFAQATMPQGWINWFGVAPDERRKGVGRALLAALVGDVRAHSGTHLAAFVDTADGVAFLGAQKFSTRGRRLLLIRRADGAPGATPPR